MEGYQYGEANRNERAGKVVIAENSNNGVTVRSIREAFTQAEKMKKEKHVNIYVSFLQIYNEKVFDLLNSTHLKSSNSKVAQSGLKIRWS